MCENLTHRSIAIALFENKWLTEFRESKQMTADQIIKEIEALPKSTDPPRLRARLIQPRLVDNLRWEHVEALTFSFQSGEFYEVTAA